MGFLTPDKKYEYRHNILGYLYEKIKNEPLHRTDLGKSESSYEEIAVNLNILPYDLKEYHEAFHTFEDDHVVCANKAGKATMKITLAGINAYVDRLWIREGNKEVNERIYDKTKWLFPLIALIITAFSLWYSISSVRHTSEKLERLQREVDALKK